MDKLPRRIYLSIPFFVLSFLSTAPLFFLLIMTAHEIGLSYDLHKGLPIIPFFIITPVIGFENYFVTLLSKNQKISLVGRLREIILLLLFFYLFIQLFLFVESGQLSYRPNFYSVFFMVFSFLFWLSHFTVLEQLMSRLVIAGFLEHNRGETLVRVLRDVQPVIQESYTMVSQINVTAILRMFLTLFVVLIYSGTQIIIPPLVAVFAVLSFCIQLILFATSQIFADDHNYLAYGAVITQNQRGRRTMAVIAISALAMAMSLLFARNVSVFAPKAVYDFFASLFRRINLERGARRIEDLTFLVSRPNLPPPSVDSYIAPSENNIFTFLLSFLNNLLTISLLILIAYLLLAPFLHNPKLLNQLLHLPLNKGFKIFLRAFKYLAQGWLLNFLDYFLGIFLMPFKGFFFLVRKLQKLWNKDDPVKSLTSQNEFVKNLIQQRMAQTQSEEKEFEIQTLGHLFTRMIFHFEKVGLTLKKSNTIREIITSCQTLMVNETEDQDIIQTCILTIGLCFEESLFSTRLITEPEIAQAQQALKTIAALPIFQASSSS